MVQYCIANKIKRSTEKKIIKNVDKQWNSGMPRSLGAERIEMKGLERLLDYFVVVRPGLILRGGGGESMEYPQGNKDLF